MLYALYVCWHERRVTFCPPRTTMPRMRVDSFDYLQGLS